PTAVITADRLSGPAPFDVQFSGAGSIDPNGDALNYWWDFGDGTTAVGQSPPLHRFLQPGTHVVKLTVTDPGGSIGNNLFPVIVEPWLLMIDASLTLTQRLAFNQVIVTNGGSLTATNGLDAGGLVVSPGSVNFGQRSSITSLYLNGG